MRAAAHAYPAAQILGIEYQRVRYRADLERLARAQPGVSVQYGNAYEIDFAALRWRTTGPLLVLGNPPWVTAAALGRSGDDVVQPPRTNLKRLRGLAAQTGAANFDVAEFLILKLLAELHREPLQLAMLVKESVARKVLAAAHANALGVRSAEIVRIDARKWFAVAVDACCLLLSTVSPCASESAIPVRPGFGCAPVGWFEPAAPPATPSAVVFRQGIKHDAADVFELTLSDGVWRNGYAQAVDIEAEFQYPLLKARALHTGAPPTATALIVPQRRLGAPTAGLRTQAPRLWRYLCSHAARIAARKSSIYRNAPPFAMFGIGPYSFAPWKVGVAGLYPQPRFRVIGPRDGRPVMLGDTSYFVPFDSGADARAFAALCVSPLLAAALAERIVRGKRPITKALLDGIDWCAFAAQLDGAPARLARLLRERAATC